MSEVALLTARKSKLEVEAKNGNRSAKRALKLASEPDRFLSTVQIGITLIGILTGIYSGDVLKQDFAAFLVRYGVPPYYAGTLAGVLIVAVVTYLTLILGELVPKRIGMNRSEKASRLIARPMYWLSVIATPFVWLLAKSTAGISKLMGMDVHDDRVTEEEIRSLVRQGTQSGEVSCEEQNIVDRVFLLGDRKVDSIMTHRNDIVWLDADASADRVASILKKNPYDVYPVGKGNTDHIVGVAYLKDLFGRLDERDFNLREVMRPVFGLHESLDVYGALERMRAARVGYGLIFDEYGSLQGIVTLKDILEGLIGTVPDEGDQPEMVRVGEDKWMVDGQCSFYDFVHWLGDSDALPATDCNTVGGLIISELGHIPVKGESLQWRSWNITVDSMEGARIDRVIVSRTGTGRTSG